MSELQLSPAEARVVAAMVEKSITTPQYYPMTVNAIMLAANQKTSRHPVMSLGEGEVGNALNRLDELKLVVRDSFSGRAQKWRHQFQHQMMLKPHTLAVLTTLMLRGPQTAAELRANASTLNGPGDGESLTAALADLADRAQPMIALLPRAAGQKEARYTHTLCGAVEAAAFELPPASVPAAERVDLHALQSRVQALELRLAELESQLGLSSPPADPADNGH